MSKMSCGDDFPYYYEEDTKHAFEKLEKDKRDLARACRWFMATAKLDAYWGRAKCSGEFDEGFAKCVIRSIYAEQKARQLYNEVMICDT